MKSTGLFLSSIAALGLATSAESLCKTAGPRAGSTGCGRRCRCHDAHSRRLSDGGTIPIKFTQAAPGVAAGEGTSPPISWTNPPAGTRSFVLNVRDLDVARNHTTDDQAHWVVWNLPATSTSLPEGVARGYQRPDGSYQISATGPLYRGPGAPASGPAHHYMFEIYALDVTLDVKPTADAFETRAMVFKAMQDHVLGNAVYGGLFKRPQ